MSELLRSLRFAVRTLARRPGVSVLAVMSVALAMGLSTATFSILDALVFRELPVKDPARLAWMLVRDRQDHVDMLNWLEFDRLRQRARSIEGAVAQSRHSPKVRLADRIDFPITAGVSDNFFDLLGVRAAAGDVFHSGNDAENVVVISDRYWRNTLGSNQAVAGGVLNVGDRELRVIGILEPGFTGTNRGVAVDLFVPPATFFRTLQIGSPADVRNTDFEVLARLRPGVAAVDSQREFETLLRQSETDGLSDAPGRKALVENFTNSSALAKLQSNGVFPAMMLIILLIAAMNIAALRLVDNELRRRDTGLRVALGAGRAPLARDHLVETGLIAVFGAAFGTVLAAWLIDLAPALLYGGERYTEYAIRMDWRTLSFSGAALVAVALAGALIPMSEAWRSGVIPLIQTRGTRRSSRWLSVLVVGQMAFVTAVACSATVLWRSLDKLAEVRPAMDPNRKSLLVRGFWEEKTKYTTAADAIADRLAALPGVSGAAYARRAMLSGSGGGAAMDVEIPGRGKYSYRYNQISPGYFGVTGARLVRGRPFERGDSADSTPVVIINDTFAHRFFPNVDPLGSWILIGGVKRQIAGVMEDGPSIHLKEKPDPYFYLPFAQKPVSHLTFFVGCTKDPDTIAGALRTAIRDVDSGFTLTNMCTLREHMNQARSDERMAAGIAGLLAAAGLALAAAGLFGVTYHSVSRRVREFGVRLAMGATAGRLKNQVLAEALKKVAVAVPLGWMLAFASRRIIERYLYGVNPADIGMLAAGAGIVGLVGVVLFQARQIIVDAKNWQPSPLADCAKSFAAMIPREDLILVTGGVCQDDGYPVAYNASFMLYWADRKGFNVCIEEQSLESVVAFTKRGAKYFLAAKSTFRYKKHLEEDLRQTYPVLAECDDYCLFQLKPHDVRD